MQITINKESEKKIIDTLVNLPKNIKRNAMASALTAGANVVRDIARTNAPACIKPTIKTVRGKKRSGALTVSVIAGGNSRDATSLLGKLDNAVSGDTNGGDGFSGRAKKLIDIANCKPAFWVEFGTYGNRDTEENPYSPKTMSKKRYINGRYVGTYASNGGKSPSYYWYDKSKWIKEKPFMRPAIITAHRGNLVQKEMIKKLDEYFKKRGISQ